MDKNENIKFNQEDIGLIMRQTNYTEEEVKKKLSTNTAIDIIKEYMKSDKESDKESDKDIDNNISKNQMIYKEIRKFMDKSSMNYYNDKY